jgi:heme/copper-type cytochrome/quinol oxidase subunit 2
MSTFSVIFCVGVYWWLCYYLLHKYRKKEVENSPPWYGKDGLERELIVAYTFISTPFHLLALKVTSTLSKKSDSGKV